ncbi:unnamed protein product [Adineta steineri]|uniref:Uncharacterized protein n=1 Tax=Adineta steineri TaxID=433720 RepID=A0A818VKQ3_9BILA|nr:unnamed protein product [Adineta steineri]CAF3713635.1 unnamed protein product [Adineta steineri]
MQSSLPIPPIPVDKIANDVISLPKSTTLLLHPNRPYVHNYWLLNDRLRLKNKKLSRRQQSSCRIAFYSLWLLIFSSIICIVIYRFTDDCPQITNRKDLFIECSKYWFLLATICITLLACGGLIFGACRYFRSQPRTFIYDNMHELQSRQKTELLPITITSPSSHHSASFTDDSSIIPSRLDQSHDDKYLHTTIISSTSNVSLQRKAPPFDYDELPSQLNSTTISESSTIHNNKNIFLLPSTSLPQLTFPATTTSNANDTTINSNKFRPISIHGNSRLNIPISYTTCICGLDIWEKQQTLSSFY